MVNSNPKAGFLGYADGLRVLSILAVIMLHTSAVRVANWPEIKSSTWWISHIMDSMCRWAVPVFIMLSGALILNPKKSYTLWGFYKKRISRVLIPALFWIPIYFFWSAYSYQMAITPEFILSSLWQGLTYNHLYFLFIIIGLYTVAPILRYLIQKLPIWTIWICLLLMMLSISSGFLMRYLPMNGGTRFVLYLPYFLMGHLLRSIPKLANVWKLLLIAFFFGATGWIVLKTYLLIREFGREDYRAFMLYDHFSPCVIAQSICIFLLAQSINRPTNPNTEKNLYHLSSVSFGIYLLHVIILDFLRTLTVSWPSKYYFFTLFFEVFFVFVLSCGLCIILKKTPFIRNLIGT